MPAKHNTLYRRPGGFWSGHLETIYPALFRKVSGIRGPERKRIETPDGDFLDLDWWTEGSKRLLILQHGLEGSSDRAYILGMAKHFLGNGFDVLAWNFRGCSGEMNRTARYYHSGATDDLDLVVNVAAAQYQDITLLGFSLGGNLTLKYLGEAARDEKIKRAVAISTPLDLDAGSDNLMKLKNRLYERRFLNNLRKKIIEKADAMPNKIDRSLLKKVKTLRDFDEYYTAPLHGFKNAADYYARCSSKFFLKGIQVPTLILNALNDPLLTGESLDPQVVNGLKNIYFETTDHGGHVGFVEKSKAGVYWSEKRALKFCLDH